MTVTSSGALLVDGSLVKTEAPTVHFNRPAFVASYRSENIAACGETPSNPVLTDVPAEVTCDRCKREEWFHDRRNAVENPDFYARLNTAMERLAPIRAAS